MHCGIYTAFLCSWSNYQSTRNVIFHEWDANKAEWGECLCIDESSWSKYNASQSLSSFFDCAGIYASQTPCFLPLQLCFTSMRILLNMSLCMYAYLCCIYVIYVDSFTGGQLLAASAISCIIYVCLCIFGLHSCLLHLEFIWEILF